MRAPFPWFGGKSRAARLVWPRFGDVPNYVEPFAGSLAMLLARPANFPPRVETVNDKDAYLANFWRAVQAAPDEVAKYADWPVNEADLHARHRWLVEHGRERVARTMADPDYFDAKVAGWWVWGQCLWIGSGWCQAPGVKQPRAGDSVHQKRRPQLTADQGVIARHANGTDAENIVDWQQRPDLNANGRGGTMVEQKRPVLHAAGDRGVIGAPLPRKRPMATGNGQGCGVHRKMPQTDRGGRGIIGPSIQGRRPNMGGRGGGQGVQAPRLTEQIPQLSGDGSGSQRGVLSDGILDRSDGLYGYMRELAARLRRVRVCCGDWTRIVTPAVTSYIGITAIFLDPPYQHDLRELCYSEDHDISAEVRAWAVENGERRELRIALCGYEGEHDMPASWDCVPWKAGGGYGRTARAKSNRHRERIWFSPHCLADNRTPLFDANERTA